MATNRHFKFINSKTGNTIYHHTCTTEKSEAEIKAELEKIKEQVAIQNGVFTGTIYWEEVSADEKRL